MIRFYLVVLDKQVVVS